MRDIKLLNIPREINLYLNSLGKLIFCNFKKGPECYKKYEQEQKQEQSAQSTSIEDDKYQIDSK